MMVWPWILRQGRGVLHVFTHAPAWNPGPFLFGFVLAWGGCVPSSTPSHQALLSMVSDLLVVAIVQNWGSNKPGAQTGTV